MKRAISLVLVVVIGILSVVGCGQKAPTWQEQYDLGVRYLSEGNYEEAIIAFTAAIEIDSKQAPAYVGRGDAYVASGETEENLTAAQADYEKAIELDETLEDVYLKLANIFIRKNDYDKAREILSVGIERIGSETLAEMLRGIPLEDISENGLNPYGGTSFTLREEYIPFSDLSKTEQDFIVQTVNAVLTNDSETLLSIVETGEEIVSVHERKRRSIAANIYTIWNNYKIGIYDQTLGLDGEHTQAYWTMQIRQKNDNGYYLSVCHHRIEDPSTVTAGWYDEYSWSVEIGTCPCVDWQWNGVLEITETYERLQHTNGYIRKGTGDTLTHGTMKDSLKNGSFEIVYEQKWDYSDGVCEEDRSVESLVYVNGRCIADTISDEIIGERQGNHIIGFAENEHETIWQGRYGYDLTDQYFLDLLYW